MRRSSSHNDKGFTLIEVLVSLVVFSVAIMSLVQANTQSVRAVYTIEEKMVAGIVADNQLILTGQIPIKTGVRTGEVVSMSRRFEYEVETTKTEMNNFYRTVVKVRHKGNSQIIGERTAFFQGATP